MGISKVRLAYISAIFLIILFMELSSVKCEICEKCEDKCGGWKAFFISQRNGTLVCGTDPETDLPEAWDKCMLECCGVKLAEDQTKCFCHLCKEQGKSFCKEPRAGSIKVEECDEQVCSGKGTVKYYGVFCHSELESHATDLNTK